MKNLTLGMGMARLSKAYIFSVIALLGIAAALKLSFALSEDGRLSAFDPLVSFLTRRQLAFLAVVLEAALAGWLLGRTSICEQTAGIFWLSLVFLTYRLDLFLLGYRGGCDYLDALWVRALAKHAGLGWALAWASEGLLAYMLVGSAVVLVWLARCEVAARCRGNIGACRSTGEGNPEGGTYNG